MEAPLLGERSLSRTVERLEKRGSENIERELGVLRLAALIQRREDALHLADMMSQDRSAAGRALAAGYRAEAERADAEIQQALA